MESKLNGITTVFFDLDGTLLDLDEDRFSEEYTSRVYSLFTDMPKDEFFKHFWEGTKQMMEHDDPEVTTLEKYLKVFAEGTGMNNDDILKRFTDFYSGPFKELSKIGSGYHAREILDLCKEKGIKIVLATNPVFPKISTEERCRWAGIDFDEFLYVSHAENSTVCKPNPRYYLELLELSDSSSENVLMVGNDCLFDMGAANVGIKTWLIDKNITRSEYRDKVKIDFEGSMRELITQIGYL